MGLEIYKKKRDFRASSEPEGKEDKKRKTGKTRPAKPVFVIQKHWASHLHYDFRLEAGGVLKSWAVPKGPSINPKDLRLAMQVEDHPYNYKDFEGEIPEGEYGGGTVRIWDKGFYYVDSDLSKKENEKIILEKLAKGSLKFTLVGERLVGNFALIQMKGSKQNGKQWLLKREKSDGKFETLYPALIGVEGFEKEKFPEKIEPMFTTLLGEAFDDDDWIFEIKWDGYRAISHIQNGKVQIYSRRGQIFNAKYPEISGALENLYKENTLVLDGEIVVLNEKGLPSFQMLQNYGRDQAGHLVYYVFDILHLEGHGLRSVPLIKRKSILREMLPENKNIRYTGEIWKNGREFFDQARKSGLEGIIAKKRLSHYQPGRRSKSWLKIKTQMRQEAVIGAYTEPRGSRKHIGALVLGVYEKGKLHYVGHTGAGQSERDLEEIYGKLKKVECEDSPFSEPVKTNEKAHFVKPKYVCEVKFSEWTSGGQMRQPILLGLREDKNPEEVHKET